MMIDDSLNNDDVVGFNVALDNHLKADGPSDDEDGDDPAFAEELEILKEKPANSSSGMAKKFSHFGGDLGGVAQAKKR